MVKVNNLGQQARQAPVELLSNYLEGSPSFSATCLFWPMAKSVLLTLFIESDTLVVKRFLIHLF